jgi:tRNA G46 methylase TrmB
VEEAVQEIERLEHGLHHQTHRNDTAGDNTKDPSALETLSICLLALARAQALLGRKEDAHSSAQRVLHAVEMATQIIQKGGSSTASNSDQRQGGKRAWKSQQDDSRRARSNQLFRAHRLQEVRREAGDLLSCFESQQKQGNNTARSVQLKLGRQIATRLYYLAGGGTSPLRTQENVNTKDLLAQLMTCKWHSFGLQTVVSSLLPQFQPSSDILSRKECKKVLKCLDLQGIRLVNSEGFIPFVDLFDREVDTPLDIELGSGFGDWIVQQAKANPGRNYVAVELRADRIAQTFARAMLQPRPLDNLCCVGAECGSFLRDFVHKNTVSTIFVNHPEPPTQTYGADQAALIKISQGDKEPAHMLSSATIINAMECLESREGRLVIVTDNQMYARLIAASAQKAIKSKPNLIMPVNQVRSMLRVETFGTVTILQGQPGEVIRHSSSKGRGIGQSYFDRLWNTGAGAHSERSKRFIIVLARSSDSG